MYSFSSGIFVQPATHFPTYHPIVSRKPVPHVRSNPHVHSAPAVLRLPDPVRLLLCLRLEPRRRSPTSFAFASSASPPPAPRASPAFLDPVRLRQLGLPLSLDRASPAAFPGGTLHSPDPHAAAFDAPGRLHASPLPPSRAICGPEGGRGGGWGPGLRERPSPASASTHRPKARPPQQPAPPSASACETQYPASAFTRCRGACLPASTISPAPSHPACSSAIPPAPPCAPPLARK